MTTITINRSDVRAMLLSESTNASRTFIRNDGVSEFESVVIDEQADASLNGAWREANAKLTEKMHPFITGSNVTDSSAQYVFPNTPGFVSDNMTMYVVDYMMQDWLASVRPDHRQQYIDRANFEMDDLLRKLYRKTSPVDNTHPRGDETIMEPIENSEIDDIMN